MTIQELTSPEAALNGVEAADAAADDDDQQQCTQTDAQADDQRPLEVVIHVLCAHTVHTSGTAKNLIWGIIWDCFQKTVWASFYTVCVCVCSVCFFFVQLLS